jgi:hypothetical protein
MDCSIVPFLLLLVVSTASSFVASFVPPQPSLPNIHRLHLHSSLLQLRRSDGRFRLYSSLIEKEKIVPVEVNGVNEQTYDAQQITVLSGLEPVQKRPGM